MSLNGLDEPTIQEAYHQASLEIGGWFLLHYVSRDSVDLLARGKGGVVDARAAITKYTETSPLYGLIFYRRRKFLIKYIPEGTSRLLQARTAVHFQDIVERYSPYETLLEITTPDGLNDTSLAASFPLHTAASPSISSSRLDEISEDAEDGPSPRRPSIPASTTSTIYSSQRTSSDRRGEAHTNPNVPPPVPSQASVARSSLRMSSANTRQSLVSPIKTSTSRLSIQAESDQQLITSPTSATKSPDSDYASSDASSRALNRNMDFSAIDGALRANSVNESIDQIRRLRSSPQSPEKSEQVSDLLSNDISRISASTERTSLETSITDKRKFDEDFDDLSKYDFTPKVKLGPRPVISDERIKRPTVASISSVPATYRPTAKRAENSRPKSHISQIGLAGYSPSPVTALPVPPIPSLPEYSPRPVSRGSIKSLQSQKSTMTAERLRLMKAVELRKRQLRRSTPRLVAITPPEETLEDTPAPPPSFPVQSVATVDNVTLVVHAAQPSGKKADSGIELDPHHLETSVPSIEGSETTNFYSEAEPSGESTPVLASSATQLDFNTLPEAGTKDLASEHVKSESEINHPVQGRLSNSEMSSADNSAMGESGNCGEKSSSEPKPHPETFAGLGIDSNLAKGSLVPKIVTPDGARPISVVSTITPTQSKEAEGTPAVSPISDGEGSPFGQRFQNGDLARRRRGLVAPLQMDEDNAESDDELLDELQSATFGEAKPVTVPKSPMGQNFAARRPSASSLHSLGSVKSVTIQSKAVNSPLNRQNDYSPRFSPDPEAISVSASPLDSSDSMAGKRNVSAGISKRIQTLTEASGREPPNFITSQATSPRPLTPDVYPDDFRPKDIQRLTKGVSVRSQTNSYQRHLGRQNTVQPAQTSARSVPSTTTTANVRGTQRSPVHPDSVTVTARIVRSHTAPGSDDRGATLQQSDLSMNYQRASSSQREQHSGPELNVGHHDEQFHAPPPNQSSGPKSWARQAPSLSPSMEDFPSPPNHSGVNVAGSRTSFMLWDDEPNNIPKEGSRTSRFFKRMSTLGASNKRKSVMQSASNNAETPHSSASHLPAAVETPPAIVVGDLNIQFPDTLLWKRRIVEVDSKGYVTFAIPLAMDIQKNSAKKYHLTDFEIPYTPDVDRQELPHSIMLDSLDGSTTLQAACEDSLSHRQVLHSLRSHWKAWNAVVR